MKKILAILSILALIASPVFASSYQSPNVAGNAATATALAANGANCGANQAAGGVNASGAAEACISPVLTEVDPTVDTSSEIQAIIGTKVYATEANLYGISTVTLGDGGSGYTPGAVILTVVQAGASGGTLNCTADGAGIITGCASVATEGKKYTVANGLATTGIGGTLATVNITAVHSPITAAGADCTITHITDGIITGATC